MICFLVGQLVQGNLRIMIRCKSWVYVAFSCDIIMLIIEHNSVLQRNKPITLYALITKHASIEFTDDSCACALCRRK